MCCRSLVKIASFDSVVCGGRVGRASAEWASLCSGSEAEALRGPSLTKDWSCTRKTFEERAEEAGDAFEEQQET